MKRLDKLILLELFGPWVFGVSMFTVLIVASTYLFQITRYLVAGAPLQVVLEMSFLVIPGVLVKTFAMATLLAGLLAFGRLSGDSEIVALRAAGVSIYRIVAPVALFSVVVAVAAFAIDETFVPYAAHRSQGLLAQLEKTIDSKSMRPSSLPIPDEKGHIVALADWQDFDQIQGVLRNTTITYFGKSDAPDGLLYAARLKLTGSMKSVGLDQGWAIEGGGFFISGDGRNFIKLDDKAWPPGKIQPTFSAEEIIASLTKDNDVLSMSEIGLQIETMRKNPRHTPAQLANLEYGYWNKLALPLAAVIYGLLGAPLGIRSGRQSTAAGFALAVGIIFAYVTLANLLNVYAQGGALPAWVASFTPLAIGLFASLFIMWRRNH